LEGGNCVLVEYVTKKIEYSCCTKGAYYWIIASWAVLVDAFPVFSEVL